MKNFKYSGKELDKMHGLNYYDFHKRFYDPLLASFLTIDPLAEKYYSISPYAYCNNNPVRYVDPTGMDWYEAESGAVIWQEGNSTSITIDDQVYNNIGETYTANYEWGSITYEQNEAVFMTETILNTNDFHSQMNSDGTKKAGQEGNCFYQSGLMVAESGAESLGGTSNDISTFTDMLDYLDSQTDVGYSTRVHVDRNSDGKGDHWVAISSRTTNLRTNSTESFGFYDPGTSRRNAGTSSTNQFNVGATTLSGNTAYNGKNYTVVNVRRNR